mgnify:CR=1 FL=1
MLSDDIFTVPDHRVAAITSVLTVVGGTIVPARTLWAGSPARYRRDLTEGEVAGLDAYWKNYLEYKEEYLREDARRGRALPVPVPVL